MSNFKNSKLRISSHGHILVCPNQHTVADCFGNSLGGAKETAKEIFRRWNCHDQLLGACKTGLTKVRALREFYIEVCQHNKCSPNPKTINISNKDIELIEAAIAVAAKKKPT